MPMTEKVAFFGATGDCVGFCLANALKARYDCVALARTPSKLVRAMEEKGVSAEALERHLVVVEGNVKDVTAVTRALQWNNRMVDTIVSGIGATPVLQWSLVQPVVLTDNTICQDAGKTIMAAAQQLNPARKPLFINVLTTGISSHDMPRDVPLLFVPLYHWLLHVPHEDKRKLEGTLKSHFQLPESQRAFRSFINIKPSLLMDGQAKGLANVRQGIDDNPAVGYTIRRADVGLWMFKLLLESEPDTAWHNKSVSLTY